MASDGPGKYRERKTRASKPYERPRGIIRRVTDSVTGLFSSSWLSGWMGGEEEESAEPQPSLSQASTLPPPGESYIFAHPVTARRSFRPFYPEEGDDGSEVSESSADTGVNASVISRPDEGEYQREILQLDDESLQNLRESLTKPVPSTPMGQPATSLPSLEETRKRPRDMEPDHSSIRAEGSVSSKSLFSEAGDVPRGQPQPSALASKRPRFNVSIYGSPVLSDKSVLSDSTFKASPFYPGRTMYGGASAYRSRRVPARGSQQASRAQVKPKPAPQASDDGGLSQAARRILESLESMSTPISDAKRIPTPTPGQRGSFLDSYTPAFHRHRPSLRPSAPPSTKLMTPSKVTVQENFSSHLLPSASQLPDSPFRKSSGSGSRKESASQTETKKTEQREEKSSENSVASLFSKAAAETTAKFLPSQPTVPVSSAAQPQDVFKFGVSSSSNSASLNFEFTPKPTTALAGDNSKRFGKMKSKLVDSGRTSNKYEDQAVEEPNLNPVPLPLPSLPKIGLLTPSGGQGSQSSLFSSPEGFKFSIPEIMDLQAASESLDNAPNFTFRNPTLIGEGSNTPSPKVSMPTMQPSLMFNSSSSSLLGPKLKTNAKKDVTSSEKLKEGSILDILKPKGKLPENSTLSSSPVNDEKTVISSKPFSMTNSDSSKSMLGQPVNSIVKKPDSKPSVQGFGSMFKKSSDEWECSVCMLRNKNASVKCVACETQRPGEAASGASKDAVVGATKSSGSWAGNGAAWGDSFRKSSGEWDCDTCMVRNKDSVSKCVACETPRPGAKSDAKTVPDTAVDTKEKTNTSGFGAAFAKQKGEWECDTCLVRNKSDATKCISCETPKPGAATISEAITGNFKFGVNTTANDSPSLSFTFKEKTASSGFSFGVGAKSIQEESKGTTGFKFGVPAEKPNALTVHTFGSNAESDTPKDKVASSNVTFSFGVHKTDTKADTEEAKKPLLFGGKSADSVESVTSTTPAFQFGSGAKTQVAFSFDSGSQEKPKEEQKVNASSSLEAKTAVSDEVKSFKTNDAVFGVKEGGMEANTSKATFTFNSVSTSNSEEETTKATVASPFGGLANREPLPAAVTTVPPTATSTAALTVPFGATTGASTTSSGTDFAFGDKSSTQNTFAFSFTSPAPPANKEENKPAPTFSFNAKVDSSDTSEPAKKLSFSTPAFGATINNGVSAPPSLFTFGSKENKLGSGTGFGTPPSNSPAFGAPAPASNATPAFQFGNSNPPAPAATAPSAFGGSTTPAFGSTVNNSNSGFAFGQPSEKKSSTGFDFGQAASSTSPSFNFAAVPPVQGLPQAPVFQFGQSQTNNSSPGGLFQFGSRNSEVQSPGAPFGNNENPFNTVNPGPPSGRVMKKAVRRSRK